MEGFMAGVIVGGAVLLGIAGAWPESTTLYRQGQIDALTGVVTVELVKQPDGSMTWERKKSNHSGGDQ